MAALTSRQKRGLSRQHQLHFVRRLRAGARRRFSRRDQPPRGRGRHYIAAGYAYERAPDQKHFLNRNRTKQLFRDIFAPGKTAKGKGSKEWGYYQSSMFLDFLAGNQSYHCTPWGNPTRTVFGWQRPCYLLGEGYAKTFKELMESTDWDKYGVGNYEKCADCMVHSGFEASAVTDAFSHPLKMLKIAVEGVRTDGPMKPDIALDKQRPAGNSFFSRHRRIKARRRSTTLDEIRAKESAGAN